MWKEFYINSYRSIPRYSIFRFGGDRDWTMKCNYVNKALRHQSYVRFQLDVFVISKQHILKANCEFPYPDLKTQRKINDNVLSEIRMTWHKPLNAYKFNRNCNLFFRSFQSLTFLHIPNLVIDSFAKMNVQWTYLAMMKWIQCLYT